MKKIILFAIFLICACVVNAQSPTGVPQLFNGKWYKFNQFVGIDSALLVGSKDTNWIPRQPSLVFWQNSSSDTAFWYYNGRKWNKMGNFLDTSSLSNRINKKQDSIKLTTTGSSGVSTLIGSTLNIPNYGSALTGYVPYIGATTNVDLDYNNLTGGFLFAKAGVKIQDNIVATGGTDNYTSMQTKNTSFTFFTQKVIGGLTYKNAATFLYANPNATYTNYYNYNLPTRDGTLALLSDQIDTTSLSNRINLKLNISDTASMLSPYLRKADTLSLSNRINLKLNISDTAAMLSPYQIAINARVKYTDTASMLAPYLRKADTASLSNRINLKADKATTLTINGTTYDLSANRSWTIPTVDTTSLSNRINLKLNISDTAAMLSPYQIAINARVKYTDTASMLSPYLRKLDTASLSNRINLKQNILSLTTTGTSGAATLVGATLNIPQYQSVLTNPITGTGTINTVAKFTSSSAIGNSNIKDDGNVVTVSTTAGGFGALQVGSYNGNILMNTTNTTGGLIFQNTSSSNKLWDISSYNNDLNFNESNIAPPVMVLKPGGNVLFGTTSNDPSGGKIQVSGTVQQSVTSAMLKASSTGVITAATSGSDYQAPITLTTTGSSGASTLIGSTLNIPNYGSATGFVPYTGATNDVNIGTHNYYGNAFFNGFTSAAASGTQIVLTVLSAPEILITGSGGQTIKLPDATTLSSGTVYSFNNNQSSGAILVNNNSNTLILSIPSGGYAEIILLDNLSAAGSWDKHFQAPSNVSWSTNTFDYPGSITSATWNGNVVQPNRGGTGQNTYTDGQLLIGNSTGNTLSKSTLTAGTGISITNGSGSISVASSITQYTDALARSAISLTTTGTSGAAAYSNSTGVLNIPQYQAAGTYVTSVTGTSPIVSSGGTTPAISIPAATSSVNGYLTSTDWTTFNNKSNTNGTVTSVATGLGLSGGTITTSGTLLVDTASASILSRQRAANTYYLASNPNGYTNNTGTVTSVAALTLGTSGTDLSSTVANSTTTPVITLNVPTASATNRGALSSADWSTFNAKVSSVTATSPLASSGGTTPNITIQVASGSQNGYLSSTDWTTFNNKTSNTGTVTSVATSGTVSGLTLTGGTITTTGTITLGGTLSVLASNFASQTANTVLAAPNGSAGVPTFRALVATDIPSLSGSYLPLTGGTLTGALGGTSATFSGTIASSGGNVTVNGGTIAAFNNGGIEIYNTSNAAFARITSSSGGLTFNVNNNSTTALTLASTGAATFSSSVTANGNVTINGNRTIYLTNPSTAAGSLVFYNSTSSTIKSGLASYYNIADEGNLEFLSGGSSTKMVLTSGGNVGIGTTSPSKKLHVYGTSTVFEGMLVENSNSNAYSLYQSKTANSSLWQWGTWNDNSYRTGISGVGDFITITSGGNVLIGRTTSGLTNSEGVTISSGSVQPESTGYVMYGNRTTSDGLFIGIRRNNVDVGSISVTTSATAFNTSSDYRLKTDFKEFNGLSIIDSIKTYDYAWKLDSTRAYGVKAHELQTLLPYVVFGEKDEVNEDGSIKPQAVDYSKLVPILIKSVQELSAKNEALIKRIETLENK
jgi:hypothetical protein